MAIDFYCHNLPKQLKTTDILIYYTQSYHHLKIRKPSHKKRDYTVYNGQRMICPFMSFDAAYSGKVAPMNLTVIITSPPLHDLECFYFPGFLFPLTTANPGLTSTWLSQWHHLWPKGRPACIRRYRQGLPWGLWHVTTLLIGSSL